MDVDFFAAHGGGADYDFVVSKLAAIFSKQGVIPPQDSFALHLPVPVRPVGLIFGRPTCKIFKEELLPDRAYYNLRSGSNIELFYMGYADPDEEYVPVGVFDDNDFSEELFVSAVSDFEKLTTWQYSGATDLILLNSFFSPKRKVYFDFKNVLALQLEAAVERKLISNGGVLIEEIMRQSRYHPSEDVVMRISDVLFLRNGRDAFLTWLMGLVKLKAEDLSNAYKSCVRDVSRKPAPVAL